MQRVLGLVVVALGFVGVIYVAVDRMQAHENAENRRAIEARAAALGAQAARPGTPLACLDGALGDAIETACEPLLFARPDVLAAAVAHVGVRLDLLNDARDRVRGDAAFDRKLAGLRRATELDRFGIAAHVLAVRDGCTPDRCDFFAALGNADSLKSNMRARVFAQYVDRYRSGWEQRPSAPAGDPAPPPVASVVPPPSAHTQSSQYDFPSAASIPPVSIMNAEPQLPAGKQGDGKGTESRDAESKGADSVNRSGERTPTQRRTSGQSGPSR